MRDSASTVHPAPLARPRSDVSAGVGLAGLLGLALWILFCRNYAGIAEAFGIPGPRAPLSGPHAALAALLFTSGPMVIWSLLVDKVHLRASTGIDWSNPRKISEIRDVSIVKLAGLWATWAIIAGLYCLARWYWDGRYLFAMEVLGAAIIPARDTERALCPLARPRDGQSARSRVAFWCNAFAARSLRPRRGEEALA